MKHAVSSTFGAGIICFFNFNTPVYKIWIIQETNTLELWNKLHFDNAIRIKRNMLYLNLLAPELLFLILAQPVYKIRIIQETYVRIMKQTAFW